MAIYIYIYIYLIYLYFFSVSVRSLVKITPCTPSTAPGANNQIDFQERSGLSRFLCRSVRMSVRAHRDQRLLHISEHMNITLKIKKKLCHCLMDVPQFLPDRLINVIMTAGSKDFRSSCNSSMLVAFNLNFRRLDMKQYRFIDPTYYVTSNVFQL